jgi:hypothetical protein
MSPPQTPLATGTFREGLQITAFDLHVACGLPERRHRRAERVTCEYHPPSVAREALHRLLPGLLELGVACTVSVIAAPGYKVRGMTGGATRPSLGIRSSRQEGCDV